MEGGCALSSIRIRFLRGEGVKYISHLDLMKVFERAIRRSRLPIAYSQGFNPHPQMVFGLPLSVGVTSEAEYGDFEMAEDISPEDFMERLNHQLPAELRILDAAKKDTRDNIMAAISLASYEVKVLPIQEVEVKYIMEKLNSLMDMPSITVKKETKRGVKDVDIRPMIHSIELADDNMQNNTVVISMKLSAGSKANLKPELVIEALNGAGLYVKIAKVHRTELFVDYEGQFKNPLDASVLTGT